MNNQSGKTFENAKIKLMAGDVNKIQPQTFDGYVRSQMVDALSAGSCSSRRHRKGL